MENRKFTLAQVKESLENGLMYLPDACINLHSERSYSSDTVFSTMIVPLDKALLIFGDCEVMYPQMCYIPNEQMVCVKMGVVVNGNLNKMKEIAASKEDTVGSRSTVF